MKKIILSLATVTLFVVTSCSDFLDTENLTKKDTSNFPATTEEANQLLTAAYSIMVQMNTAHPYIMGTVLSDECFGGGGSGDLLPHAVSYLRCTSLKDFEPIWPKYYSGIYRVNSLLAGLDNASWTDDYIVGQAYYLRAQYYYQLAILFGTVPLITEPKPLNLPKASAEELFGLILSDLKHAIDLMPATPQPQQSKDSLGRATKWAAEALMARAYLFYDGYYKQNTRASVALPDGGSITKDNVVAWLDDCIKNSGHELANDFRNQWPYSWDTPLSNYKYAKDNGLAWLKEDGDNRETIFAIKYTSTAGWSSPNSPLMCAQLPIFYGFRNFQNFASFGSGWGWATVNAKFWDGWADNDLRKKGSIIDISDPDEGLLNFAWGAWDAWHETGYYIKKYFPFNVTINENGENKNVSYSSVLYNRTFNFQLDPTQDLVIMRFADVLLMHSELTKTVDGINRVRVRAGLETIGAYTDEALQNERRYELAFENVRYYDLLRWYGTEAGVVLKKNMDGCVIYNNLQKTTINEDRGKPYFDQIDQRIRETGGFMQIPNNEIELSDGVLTQNPGWEGSEYIFN